MKQAQATSTTTQPSAALRPSVTALLRGLRMSPRKVRLVAATVAHMPATSAVNYLKVLPKAAALPLAKLIASAVANARHNFQIAPEDLVVEQILVNQGPTLKRWRARAFGRAAMIRHRTSHIALTLSVLPSAVRPATAAAASTAPAELKTVTLEEVKQSEGTRGDASSGPGQAGGSRGGRGFRRKLFQRKSG